MDARFYIMMFFNLPVRSLFQVLRLVEVVKIV